MYWMCNTIYISYTELYLMRPVREFTNTFPLAAAGERMTDLLTTREVQELLQVDRTPIYRMVEGGPPARGAGPQAVAFRPCRTGSLAAKAVGGAVSA